MRNWPYAPGRTPIGCISVHDKHTGMTGILQVDWSFEESPYFQSNLEAMYDRIELRLRSGL